MKRPVITLLTDYGLRDEFVGVCHGVIAGICPQARVIDVTHGIARHDVLGGALRLAAALPYLPGGVHLAVVDPGVGSDRRAVAVRCLDERFFVGPDNGLLGPAIELSGGATDITEETSEDQLLALERKAFQALIRTDKTLARIEHTLETGRPLRN